MSTLEIRTKVILNVCPHSQPGTMVRIEPNRVVVLWHDLDVSEDDLRGWMVYPPFRAL